MRTDSGRRPALGSDGRGLVLFRLAGVPVLLAPSWWIGSVAVTLLYTPLVDRLAPGVSETGALLLSAAFALLLGVSVLAHELGHCLVALRLGLPVRRLRLFLLGGLSEVARTPRAPRHEGLVAGAGPAVSVALAALCGLLLLAVPPEGALWVLVLECAMANTAVALFNLLPGLPLDGGRLLRAGVWAATGRRSTGTKAAVFGGGMVAALLLAWAIAGLAGDTEDRWLRLGVCLITAWFVVAGASGELAAERRHHWPDGLRLVDIVRPVLQLPAESPVADAYGASAGRGVVLVRADGVAVGLLDRAAAAELARRSPLSPAEQAAQPLHADTVLLDSDSGEDVLDRVTETTAWQFLVVDAHGRPSGVLRREDLPLHLS